MGCGVSKEADDVADDRTGRSQKRRVVQVTAHAAEDESPPSTAPQSVANPLSRPPTVEHAATRIPPADRVPMVMPMLDLKSPRNPADSIANLELVGALSSSARRPPRPVPLPTPRSTSHRGRSSMRLSRDEAVQQGDELIAEMSPRQLPLRRDYVWMLGVQQASASASQSMINTTLLNTTGRMSSELLETWRTEAAEALESQHGTVDCPILEVVSDVEELTAADDDRSTQPPEENGLDTGEDGGVQTVRHRRISPRTQRFLDACDPREASRTSRSKSNEWVIPCSPLY